MASLRETMARNGFESNDDYEFQVRCLLQGPADGIRTLSIEGDGERRKTAFATALAHALERPHVLYHDFADRTRALPEVILPEAQDEYGRKEPPIEPLDDIVSHACALSEAEGVVLILDQLQAADFREHIRIHRLVRDRRWQVRDAGYDANPRHLLLFLISEEPLYHALQRASFRVWVSRVSERRLIFRPAEFGLASDAVPLFAALGELFRALAAAPTRSEMQKLLHDLIHQVQTEADLCHAVFGRCEGIDRQRLFAADTAPALTAVIDALRAYIGTEQIEIGGD
ncbi:hypothetical protein [uncultured Thiohalocapsa sp.]|uniref:hypothetical protein n=1 Tax=uncultured Thiohalocapsa sp. TaxID=768990 RepID=UPI0025DF563E|nr:hypothetical protein [uncultured Thiohalocapsa sp.]